MVIICYKMNILKSERITFQNRVKMDLTYHHNTVYFFCPWEGTNNISALGKQAVSSGSLHRGCGNLYLLLK